MPTIRYFFSVASPWTFLGHAPFLAIAARHHAKIAYHPVELGPVFAETGGLPLAKRAPARQAYRLVELQRWRVKRQVDFHLMPAFWPFDASLADRTLLAAIGQTAEEEMERIGMLAGRIFSGVWQRQENVADPAVLAAIADEMGFPGAALVAQAQAPATGVLYLANREDAIAAGVFGAPSYVLDGEVFWGQDRLELLDDALSSGRAPFKAVAATPH